MNENKKAIKKAVRFLSGATDRLVMSIFFLMMLFGMYALYDSYSLYKNAQDSSLLAYKPKPGSTSEEVPLEGYVAWLTLDDTGIDYPVMQGENNDEFLNKDPYGNYSLSGSIFLDFRNDASFRDSYSLIYGHHMEHDTMFGALDRYKDRAYYRTHRTGTLMVGSKTYRLRIFAAVSTVADEENVFDPSTADRNGLLNIIENGAVYYDEPDGIKDAKILALSTCSSDGSIERFVVFATVEG